jgi:hypothetical protein
MLPIIDIVLDGQLFAMRDNWALIPRVGDTVILKNGEIFAEIKRVVWGEDTPFSSASGNPRQWVQLVCETIDRPS